MTSAEPVFSDEGVRVVRLPPVVDVANATDVRAELVTVLADGVKVLVADMTETKTLTLEGLQVLVLARSAASRHGAQLRLASVQHAVRRRMVFTGTERLFQLYDRVDQACASAR